MESELHYQSRLAQAAREYGWAYKQAASSVVRERAQRVLDAAYEYLNFLKEKEVRQ